MSSAIVRLLVRSVARRVGLGFADEAARVAGRLNQLRSIRDLADRLGIDLSDDPSPEEVQRVLEQADMDGMPIAHDLAETIDRELMPIRYDEWVSLGWEIARNRGFRPERRFGPDTEQAKLNSILAEIWNDHKPIETRSQAISILQNELRIE